MGPSWDPPPPSGGTGWPNISPLRKTPLAGLLVCSEPGLLRSLLPTAGTISGCLFLGSAPFRCRQGRLPPPMPPTRLLLDVSYPFIWCRPVHAHQRAPQQDGGPLAASAEMGHQLFPIHSYADCRCGIVPTATHGPSPSQETDGCPQAHLLPNVYQPRFGPPLQVFPHST